MKVDLDLLQSDGETFAGKDPVEVWGWDNNELLRPVGPLVYNFFIGPVSGELLVRGKMNATVECSCARCLEWFEIDLVEPDFIISRELAECDAVVDLTDEMREAIVLALPTYPVCDEECKGLCPYCGINRNLESCSCEAPTDDRWSGLDKVLK